jgi:hypothetical protein
VNGIAFLVPKRQFNQLPEMLENGWQLEQDVETGEYYVMVRDIRIVVIP